MDANLKTKWTAALRSGEYKQGVRLLRDGDAYCCLGVFCEVAGLPISEDGRACGAGLLGYTPLYDMLGAEYPRELWGMNDGGKPFPEIADWIDENIPSEAA